MAATQTAKAPKSRAKQSKANGAGRTATGQPSAANGAGVEPAVLEEILDALVAARDGDFSKRLSRRRRGLLGEIGAAYNELVTMNARMEKEMGRMRRVIGREGRMDQRASLGSAGGGWESSVESLNALIDDLVRPTTEVASVLDAVADGDLDRKMALTIEGQPVKGEFLRIGTTVNTMVDQLSSFADEVTRVAREVGTEGKLGGQAEVKGVSGTWRDLTESVNGMASNLTDQVRNISQVAQAVARGDLTQKITVEAKGEVAELADTMNEMTDTLAIFAEQVTSVAREVGTDGKLGGQAEVPNVSGTWKDLTESVNGMASGVVEVAMRSARPFTLEDESLLIQLADRAGLAIEHARKYEREVSNVELLQRSLLPERLPEVEGIQIAARYMPGGADVGGDWYDAIPLDGGRVGVAMGDVVGHGIGAASLMGKLRYATRAYALEGHSPAGVLDRLDRLVRSLDGGQMATLLYLVVEPGNGSIHFASAGHVPPLAIGPDGDAQYLASAPNPPLGVFESDGHVELSATLTPGSTVFLYTDGLVEERGVSIDQGLDALRLAAAQDICHPDELCDRLVEAMLAIHPADDDIAVLALRALPTAPPPFHLDIPSDPTELGRMRHELGSWLRAAGASSEVVEVVQIACHEACSNSIEHGYLFGDGELSVHAELDGRVVVLTIRDTGGWVERPDGNLPYRGNGLPMMEALMDSVELTHGNGAGTAVRMARSLVSERVAAEV